MEMVGGMVCREKQYTAMLMTRSIMVLIMPPWSVPRPFTCQS